ncbi:MAG: hypothetical protein OXF89_12030 [Rhodospirillaceae bacterium]|nr:hypothetical protein [Rhodospirillaceae bacterium]
MRKDPSEHALAAIKAGLSLVPGVGGALASLVSDYIPTATEKSRARATELLRKRLNELGERIDVEAVDKDEFAELFKSCYLSIVRSHRDEKLRAATAILANLLLREGDPDKLTYTELDHLSRCVETLSSGAVEVLATVVQEASLERRQKAAAKLLRMNFGDIHKRLPQHSPELLLGLVAELDGANLLHRGNTPMIELGHYENYPVTLTPLGLRFARFLLQEDG